MRFPWQPWTHRNRWWIGVLCLCPLWSALWASTWIALGHRLLPDVGGWLLPGLISGATTPFGSAGPQRQWQQLQEAARVSEGEMRAAERLARGRAHVGDARTRGLAVQVLELRWRMTRTDRRVGLPLAVVVSALFLRAGLLHSPWFLVPGAACAAAAVGLLVSALLLQHRRQALSTSQESRQ